MSMEPSERDPIPERQGEMPEARMESGAEGQMPSGVMEPGAGPARGEMPGSDMEAGDEGAPRFGPENLPPGGRPAAAWEPGVVEVEFRENVAPEVLAPSDGLAAEIRSPRAGELSALNQVLRRNGLLTAEPSFLRSPEEAAEAQVTARQAGVDVPNLMNFITLHFAPDADVLRVAQELTQLPEVERAVPVPTAIPPDAAPGATLREEPELERAAPEPSVRERGVAVPAIFPPSTPLNEPLVGASDQVVLNPVTGLENQWYLHRCRVDRAWTLASGSNVAIADIDWGYRTPHQDLASRLNLARAYNAYDGGSNVSHGTSISHGTAVLGLAGGADNDLGMAGVAYNAQLWPIQANSGPGAPLGGNAWARAIDWVRTADSGGRRKVIILEVQTGSFGNYEMVPSVNAAIRTAIASGVVVCVAAGNGNRDAGIDDAGTPIPDTGSILVGATEYHATENRRASFSNFNARVTVCAPGDGSHDVTCHSTSNTAYRNGFGGTSGATPKVAGTAALMLELNPTLTHAQIRDLLRATGGSVVTDAGKPVGTFLNAEQAVRAARPAAWGPFVSLGGICIHGPALASWAANRLDAFVIGTDGAIYHKFFNGAAWSGFGNLGGVCVSRPAAAARMANRLDLVVIGTDSQLYHKAWTGAAWTAFAPLGGICIHGPALAAAGPSRLDAFVIGTDNALYQKTWNGAAWGGYVRLGGVCISGPAAVSRAPNRLDVFVIGTDNAVYHRHFNGTSWSPFVSLGGVCQLGVGASAAGMNRLDVFTIGMDNALYQKSWNGVAWSAWQRLGGVCISAPAAVAPAAGRIEALVYGTNSALFQKSFA